MNTTKNLYNEIISLDISPDVAVDLASLILNARSHILIHLNEEKYLLLKPLIKNLGLFVEAERKLYKSKDTTTNNYILNDKPKSSNDVSIVEVWVCFEKNRINESRIFNNTGSSLGYPDCCVEKYEVIKDFSQYYHDYILTSEISYWQNNKLSASFLNFSPFTDFFPCSLNCEDSKKFNDSIIKISKKILPKFIYANMIKIMKSPIIINGDAICIIKEWEIINNDCIHASVDNIICKKFTQILKKIDFKISTKPFIINFSHLNNMKKIVLFDHDNEKQEIFF